MFFSNFRQANIVDMLDFIDYGSTKVSHNLKLIKKLKRKINDSDINLWDKKKFTKILENFGTVITELKSHDEKIDRPPFEDTISELGIIEKEARELFLKYMKKKYSRPKGTADLAESAVPLTKNNQRINKIEKDLDKIEEYVLKYISTSKAPEELEKEISDEEYLDDIKTSYKDITDLIKRIISLKEYLGPLKSKEKTGDMNEKLDKYEKEVYSIMDEFLIKVQHLERRIHEKSSQNYEKIIKDLEGYSLAIKKEKDYLVNDYLNLDVLIHDQKKELESISSELKTQFDRISEEIQKYELKKRVGQDDGLTRELLEEKIKEVEIMSTNHYNLIKKFYTKIMEKKDLFQIQNLHEIGEIKKLVRAIDIWTSATASYEEILKNKLEKLSDENKEHFESNVVKKINNFLLEMEKEKKYLINDYLKLDILINSQKKELDSISSKIIPQLSNHLEEIEKLQLELEKSKGKHGEIIKHINEKRKKVETLSTNYYELMKKL